MNNDQITVQALKAELQQNPQAFYLLDVRTWQEWQAFHLSENLIPLAELNMRLNEIPRDTSIVVYCRSGHRSQTALTLLKSAGFEKVQNLIGGVLAWQQNESIAVSC